MPNYTQKGRPLRITTPLGPDVLLLTGLDGVEAISRLFRFEVELLADKKDDIAFDKLLGNAVTVEIDLPTGGTRHVNGIVSRFSQGAQSPTFTTYRAEIVPKLWLLTRKAQSRIFQHVSVPEILKTVLSDLDVRFEIQGTFHPRDYCVQYRESDFNFASRLMEEEGIFFFFEHTSAGHSLIVANTPPSHPGVPGETTAIYEEVTGGNRPDARVLEWSKTQELRSGKYTLWDHCFELPHKHLEADKDIVDSIEAGTVTHKLKVGGNAKLEIYDFPGEYAQRFDGIDRGGGERPAEVQKIFEDNTRTTGIRMQEEALRSLIIDGVSNCAQFVAGHRFTLERHFDANGEYVLTSVVHSARTNAYRSNQNDFSYTNEFQCIPVALPFRPPRVTPKPLVGGTQSAVVVGPPGEEIFTDKYSRVKVQFHWDRAGKLDADSSCWIRVATTWAGQHWGTIHIPRIGQEVLVDFLEGDPDNPIIVGSVYNADMMPPYDLPDGKTRSGVKSRSSLGGGSANFNEIRFEDKKGSEQLFIHAEKNQDIEVENSETHTVGANRRKTIGHNETTHVKNDRTETVDNDETITIHGNRTETVARDESITIAGKRTEVVAQQESVTIGATRDLTVGSNETHTVGISQANIIGASRAAQIGGSDSILVAGANSLTAGGAVTITSGGAITISAGGAIAITAGGAIAISAPGIVLNGRPVLPIPAPI